MSRSFWYVSFMSLFDFDVKLPSFLFSVSVENMNIRRQIFKFLNWIWFLQELNSRRIKIRKALKFQRMQSHFQVTFPPSQPVSGVQIVGTAQRGVSRKRRQRGGGVEGVNACNRLKLAWYLELPDISYQFQAFGQWRVARNGERSTSSLCFSTHYCLHHPHYLGAGPRPHGR